MRYLFYSLLIILLVDCRSIATSAIEYSISESRGTKGSHRFKEQHRIEGAFRQRFFDKLKADYDIDVESRSDTLILVEHYDNVCGGCYFYRLNLVVGFTVFGVNAFESTFKGQPLAPTLLSIERDTITAPRDDLARRIDGLWKLKTLQYSTNPFDPTLYSYPCDDGSSGYITWIMPGLACRSALASCF